MFKVKLIISFLILLFTVSEFFAQTPDWIWAKSARKNGDLNSVAIDNSGNCYAAGVFGPDSMVFNTTTLSLNWGGTADIFLVKYDPNGNVLWARQSSIVASCRAVCIATDAFNNVYMVGDYRGGMALDTVGLTSYPNNNTDNVFVAKFDPNGPVMWAKRVGGDYYTNSYYLAVDNNGNVFVTGDFIGSYVNFGSITLLNPDPVNKTGSTFLAKYNTNGNILWAKNTTGNSVGSNGCWPSALATDASGNVYLTGQFNTSTVGFSSSVSLIKTGLTDVFLTKYNSSGTALWTRKPNGDNYQIATGVAVCSNGDILMTGYFESDTLKFGSTVLTNTQTTIPHENLFLAKYSSTGNVTWAKSKGRTKVLSIGIDNLDNTYLLGNYRDSTQFGNNKLKYNNIYGNIFLAKYNVNGIDLWGKDAILQKAQTGNSFIMPHSISPRIVNDIYIGGGFDCKRIKMDSCSLTNWDTTGNSRAILLAKINTTYVGLNEKSLLNSILSVFPNPFDNQLSIKCSDESNIVFPIKLSIKDVSGKEIKKLTLSEREQKIDVNWLKSGCYFLEFQVPNSIPFVEKIIKK